MGFRTHPASTGFTLHTHMEANPATHEFSACPDKQRVLSWLCPRSPVNFGQTSSCSLSQTEVIQASLVLRLRDGG